MDVQRSGMFESAEAVRARMHAAEELRLFDTEPEQEFDELVRLAGEICNTPVSLMTLLDRDRQYNKSHIGTDIRDLPLKGSLCRFTVQVETVFVVNDTMLDPRFHENTPVLGDEPVRFYAGVPLIAGAAVPVGTLCVIDNIPRELSAQQIRALQVLGRQVSLHLQLRLGLKREETWNALEQANRDLQTLALTDELTHLWNRRAFDARLEAEVYLSHNNSQPLSLLMIDVDNFKQLNDEHGHRYGDEVLEAFAALLRRVVREADVATRFGGEEFAVILPGSRMEGAYALCHRLNTELKSAAWGMLPLTVSVGIAACLPGCLAEELLKMADDAMYQAKRSGKDCVVAYEVRDAAVNAARPS